MLALLRRFLISSWLVVALLLFWWKVSANSENYFWPPLSQIASQFKANWLFTNVVDDVIPSLKNLAIGYFIGAPCALVVGAHLGLSEIALRIFSPLVNFFRSIPGVALVPIFIMLFGIGDESRRVSIAVAVFFPTLIATIEAVRTSDAVLLDVSRSFKFSSFQSLWRVRVPSGAPMISSGLQVSLQVGFIVMIVSEMLGAFRGLGAFTVEAQQSFMIIDMWTGIIMLGILGYIFNVIFELIEKRALRWYRGQKGLTT